MSGINSNRNPWKRLLNRVKDSARPNAWRRKGMGRRKAHIVSITWEDLVYQFNKQKELCYWLEIPLNPYDIFDYGNVLAISVDRLDNSKGYIKENIVIACRFANMGRGNCNKIRFKKVIKKIRSGRNSLSK